MLYLSDSYGNLEDVNITGFFEYFDSSYGKFHKKNVINFHMTREEFEKTDFSQVRVSSLFDSRLKPKKSKGIYSLETTDVKELQN